MKKKVTLTFEVSQETRKMLKMMAAQTDKTMASLIEELITIRWKEHKENTKDGII